MKFFKILFSFFFALFTVTANAYQIVDSEYSESPFGVSQTQFEVLCNSGKYVSVVCEGKPSGYNDPYFKLCTTTAGVRGTKSEAMRKACSE